jgi:cytochrome c5
MLHGRLEMDVKGRARPALVTALALVAMAATQHCAASGDRSGREIVENVCATCHATGRDGAPKIGDAKAWGPRERRGLSSLTGSALEGVRKMPPHGGALSLTDLEIKRAITYMVNHSGGSWVEPIDRTALPVARTGQQIVQTQCVKCHGTGLNGAPRIGDKSAWIDRAKLGFDSVVRSAIHGHGAMPARGGMADLTDDEMRAAVTYMFQKSVKPPK